MLEQRGMSAASAKAGLSKGIGTETRRIAMQLGGM